MTTAAAAAQEAYLRGFHAGTRAGLTARAFARGDCGDGRSSYDWLLDAVLDPGGAPPARVLDLGCGDGHLIERLHARSPARAIGLDLAAGELAAARARLGPGAALIQARAQAIPLAAGALDAVVSHLAFTLMPELDVIAAELARVLAPGGRFAAIVGGGPPAEPEGFGAFLDVVATSHARASVPRLGDPRGRDRAGWDAVLGPHGFAITGFDRIAVDLGGDAGAVWASVASMYGVAELAPDVRDALERDARRAWQPLAIAGRIPCTMIVWRAVARSQQR